VIASAAICPPAPLLARELTGRDPVIPELREACAAAVERLVRSGPDVIAVIGPGPRTGTWPAAGRFDLGAFAPALGTRGREPQRPALATGAADAGPPPLPAPLGLGARLLDESGYQGPRLLQSVSGDDAAAACLRLGDSLRGLGGRTGLLVMADGSACRSQRAPGYLDPRAAAFDEALGRAVRGGDLGALQDMDEVLARELLVTARPAWQVLAGAMPGRSPAAEILYSGAPFGVFYLVAAIAGSGTGCAPYLSRPAGSGPAR
jgi:hypothetical protein